MKTLEKWKKVPGFPGYKASTFGRVKSNKRGKWEIRNPCINSSGYYQLSLMLNNNKFTFRKSIIIAMTFFEYVPGGFNVIVDHRDNNKLNDYRDNLQLITVRLNSSKDKKDKTSKYTGVSWDKAMNKWRAAARIKGKKVFLGYHDIEEDAALAYTKKIENI